MHMHTYRGREEGEAGGEKVEEERERKKEREFDVANIIYPYL